ncbi:alpha/beta fold hydrolase [Herbaspirillum rubrisubalbicans]|uniref:Alpha/beta hydrolase n=1 Tax=Herbaspirillum rubrisubalbicans TaxID=80842 RepID=A0AAD0U7E1_9BURK|nr:alpha/beta hydrolase [Herbaspirillum rubrisubalbicans]AYR23641.1 alpha/beta hydrolase [Herbaspirillum rubrisubalbicans]
MQPQQHALRRQFIQTTAGPLHVASMGQGRPVLLLHQTPRSWDEYRDVLPLLGQAYWAIAIDTLGFGDSCKPPLSAHSIERWAQLALEVMDQLGISKAAVVGHHTGAATAMEIAAAAPERVAALVLSSCSYNDAAHRSAHAGKRAIDDVVVRADGSHLQELWQRRQPYYPPGDTELLSRFMMDALKAGEMAAHGHMVVRNYVMEARIGLVHSPTLVLRAGRDPHAAPYAERIAQLIAGSQLETLEEGMVPMPDQIPGPFAQAVLDFLQRVWSMPCTDGEAARR